MVVIIRLPGIENRLQRLVRRSLTWYRRWLSRPEVEARQETASDTLGSSLSLNQTGGVLG